MPYTRAEKDAHDRDIAKRLREFRDLIKVPRTVVAVTIRIGSERLASYEAGRARVKYLVVEQLMQHFKLNPVWLATGKGSPTLTACDFITEIFDEFDLEAHADFPFAWIYFDMMEQKVAEREKAFSKEANSHLAGIARIIARLSDPCFSKQLTAPALARALKDVGTLRKQLQALHAESHKKKDT